MARHDLAAGVGFISPWLVGFMIFMAGPFVVSIIFSFTEYDVLSPARWVGARHYVELFTNDPIFWKSLGNTLFMMIGIPIGMAVGLGIAMLLNAEVKGMSWYRTIYYLPAVVPTVAASILWIWVLHPTNGMLNILLEKVGLGQPLWLQSEDWSKPAIIVMGLWGAGSSMIIWLAGLKGIPAHLYEAAQIDGASDVRQYWHIALPLSKSIIGTLAIMTTVFVWNDYIWPLVAADNFKTVSIGLAYLTKQHSTSWGPLMAGYAIASIPLLVLFTFTMRYFVEGIATGAIKA